MPTRTATPTHNNDTATLSGAPVEKGVYSFKIRATFGTEKAKHVVAQQFTLTVNPDS
jgi:hypothetical protein